MEVLEQEAENVEMGGCMGGFFNIFDRPHHLLSPKRISSSKKEDSGIQQQGGCNKEAPRLSLDSRAVVDAKGSLKPKQEREGSPSVIARLMGLEEPLPSLQRSASESRVRRSFNFPDEKESVVRSARAQPARATATQMKRKSLFDFPEPRLETLEALRLKGLLHSSNKRKSRNLVQSRASQGKTLLERCDKLLHSIAEMAASEAGDSQPSPVSVLDEDSSPVMKRTLHFQEDQSWEYVYISDILRASHCLPQESDIFSFLEKHQFFLKGKHYRIPHERRLLIFDAVQEILGERRRRVGQDDDKMQVIWFEFQTMRKTRAEDDLVGRVLSEDRWQECEVEMSEAVLDIERLIFKDLIGDTIRDLAALNRSHSLLRRRLVFF